MTNKELLEKAIITADALATQGKLLPAQADRFIDYVIDESVLKNKVRIVKFRNEEMLIDKIGVGGRVTVPKAEATDPGARRGVTTSKVTLKPAEVMTPFEIGDTFMDINLEGEDVEDHVIQMMAKQLSNDMEELALVGNTVGPTDFEDVVWASGSATKQVLDVYLALASGWLRLADGGNIYDAGGANIGPHVLSKIINAMPTKFKKNRRDLKFFASADHEQNYRETVSTRATNAGDQALTKEDSLKAFAIELVSVPLLDAQPKHVEHVTMTGTTAQNLAYKPFSDEIVVPSTIGREPVTPYIKDTDYAVDYTNGTITRDAGGSIGDGAVVKVTYKTYGQILLTQYRNLIWAIGRDIRIERDRDIYKGVNQYAITTKIFPAIEELTAVVKAINVGLS